MLMEAQYRHLVPLGRLCKRNIESRPFRTSRLQAKASIRMDGADDEAEFEYTHERTNLVHKVRV